MGYVAQKHTFIRRNELGDIPVKRKTWLNRVESQF